MYRAKTLEAAREIPNESSLFLNPEPDFSETQQYEPSTWFSASICPLVVSHQMAIDIEMSTNPGGVFVGRSIALFNGD
jgi:hypothetical protein